MCHAACNRIEGLPARLPGATGCSVVPMPRHQHGGVRTPCLTALHALQRCKVYKSARAPVRLVFNARRTAAADAEADSEAAPRQPDVKLDAWPGHSPWRGPDADVVQLMFKSGDDLRQDQFVCQARPLPSWPPHSHLTARYFFPGARCYSFFLL
jgi:hypothetical protein